jgi:hypothetical protein
MYIVATQKAIYFTKPSLLLFHTYLTLSVTYSHPDRERCRTCPSQKLRPLLLVPLLFLGHRNPGPTVLNSDQVTVPLICASLTTSPLIAKRGYIVMAWHKFCGGGVEREPSIL